MNRSVSLSPNRYTRMNSLARYTRSNSYRPPSSSSDTCKSTVPSDATLKSLPEAPFSPPPKPITVSPPSTVVTKASPVSADGNRKAETTEAPVVRDATRKASALWNPQIAGKLCLITDACTPTGMAIARALLHRGASLVLVGPDMESLKTCAAELCELYPDMPETCVRVVCGDAADESSVETLFNSLDVYTNRKLGLVVNNFEELPESKSTLELSSAEFQRVLQRNLVSPFLCSREAIKRMKESSRRRGPAGGRIINIGSLATKSPPRDAAALTTAKFALQGLTQSLALDAQPHGIAVGIIHPGTVQTSSSTSKQDPDDNDHTEATVATDASATTITEVSSAEDPMILNNPWIETAPATPTRKDEGVLTPEDVAHCVVQMACLPYSVNVLEMTVYPSNEAFVGRG